jgi:hypothetical protein
MIASKTEGFATTSGVFHGSFTITNKGPSTTTVTSASFSVYTEHLKLIDASNNQAIVMCLSKHPVGNALGECRYLRTSTYYHQQEWFGYAASCPVGALEPGESVTVSVTYWYPVPQGEFFEAWPISWVGFADLLDPKLGNNAHIRLQAACRPARPPICRGSS